MKIDIEKIKKLIAETTDEIGRGNLMVHLKSYQQTRQAYTDDPSAAHLRDWQAAERGLIERVREIEGDRSGTGMAFASIAEVLEHLEPVWQVTKTSLYRHQKEGKLSPKTDGTYGLRDVEKYARTYLKQKATGKKVKEQTDELQRKKLELELDNLDLEKRRKQLAYDKDLGKFVPRELMEVELATRAGVIEAGLKHLVQSRSAEWLRTAGADTKKVGDLINVMNRDLDELINSYASALSYQVVIDAEEESEDVSNGHDSC
jgi:hypothetical protein